MSSAPRVALGTIFLLTRSPSFAPLTLPPSDRTAKHPVPRAAWSKIAAVDLTTSASTSTSLGSKTIPVSYSPEWQSLMEHTKEVQQLHLKDLLIDEERTDSMIREVRGSVADLYLSFSLSLSLSLSVSLRQFVCLSLHDARAPGR